MRRVALATLLVGALSPRGVHGAGHGDELGADGWAQMSPDDGLEHRELTARTLPNLVQIDNFRTALHAPGFSTAYGRFEGAAKMVVSGEINHPFSTPVKDVLVRIGFFQQAQLDQLWYRLMTSPLVLTQAELKRPLARPAFQWAQEADPQNRFEPDKPRPIRLETRFRDLRLDMRNLPRVFLMLDEYQLEQPSAEDLILIIQRGGVTDLAAATTWARSVEVDPPSYEPAQRRALVSAILNATRTMRPPLAHSGLQRLNTLMALTRVVAQPQDLESLLAAEGSVKVLMTSASLTYYDAVREESQLDLPVHKIRALPSLLEYLESYKRALDEVRLNAMPELVRLAFDPVDFRNAPPGLVPVSKIQGQAKTLLEPLTPLHVHELMQSAIQDPAIQQRLLRFYVEVRHAPAVGILLHWLHEHPKALETLGVAAAQRMGDPIVPALLRQFLEPQDPLERRIAKRMLLALPATAHPLAVAALRGRGAMLGPDVGMRAAITAYEEHEEQVIAHKADLLEEQIFGSAATSLSDVRRMTMVEELARIAPARIVPRHRKIFKILEQVALKHRQSAPVHATRALDLFETLPFGPHAQKAKRKRTLTHSSMAQADQDLDVALKRLLESDPELSHPTLKLAYGELARGIVRDATQAGLYGKARRHLAQAKALLPLDDRVPELERALFKARYWPAMLLGAIAGGLTLLTLAYLLARRIARRIRHKAPLAPAPLAPSLTAPPQAAPATLHEQKTVFTPPEIGDRARSLDDDFDDDLDEVFDEDHAQGDSGSAAEPLDEVPVDDGFEDESSAPTPSSSASSDDAPAATPSATEPDPATPPPAGEGLEEVHTGVDELEFRDAASPANSDAPAADDVDELSFEGAAA